VDRVAHHAAAVHGVVRQLESHMIDPHARIGRTIASKRGGERAREPIAESARLAFAERAVRDDLEAIDVNHETVSVIAATTR
jgi:hypothetical protein